MKSLVIATIIITTTTFARVIPKSKYDITYNGAKNIRGRQMHEFHVAGGPYQSNVKYYYDVNGQYFKNNDDNVEVLSRDDLGYEISNVYKYVI
ncbi:hypothetical protein G210_1161 [Candida maltosa Xu316]|uniref:Uncharacterized protein n=1 Tax=Candida maltosa (strain Xu316) TaxID=1245528 RepID=M3IPB6_CANMX|nr:hypothetical protein G210_1161 [Candida maltosa Xu316]